MRSAREILATLDDDGTVRGSRRSCPRCSSTSASGIRVSKRLEKICDYFAEAAEPRSLRPERGAAAVNLRCDGSAHDGCHGPTAGSSGRRRGCAHVVAQHAPHDPEAEAAALAELERRVQRRSVSRGSSTTDPEEVWRCQATEAPRASTPIRRPTRVGRTSESSRAGTSAIWRLLARCVPCALRSASVGSCGSSTSCRSRSRARIVSRVRRLDLEPGDVVEVRSLEEIGRTLDERGDSAASSTSAEMAPACGKRFRVNERDRAPRSTSATVG